MTDIEIEARHIHPVIEIVNGYKHFGVSNRWYQVIKNFNLAAYKGEIYVLLGPCGSGKTTVTNVILGLCHLNEGDVKIFGFSPGHKDSGVPGIRVGYSPSTHGLFNFLTVNETFKYFGRMLRLPNSYINERISSVSDLLALPPGKRLIKHCTPMERRQISFAVAILHEPELIILDEPDNQTDPVTRKCIADHLRTLTQKGCTIFMTSQNLLEAQNADRVGIVRSGYLLMEGSPNSLLKTYKEKNLEALYMHIYTFRIRRGEPERKKSVEENPSIRIEALQRYGSDGFLYTGADEEAPTPRSPFYKFNCQPRRWLQKYLKILPNCPRLTILLLRDVLLSFRNFQWIFFILIMPLIVLVVLNFTIGQPPKHVKVAVVNFEASEHECIFDPHQYISCQVLHLIDKEILDMEYYNTYHDAEKQAFQMKLSAIIIIGEKFTNQILRTLANIDLNNMDAGIPDTAQLILRIDTTSMVIANTIEHAVKKGVEDYLNEATTDTKLHNSTIGYPMKVGLPLYGKTNTEADYISIGLTIVILYHLASFIASFIIVNYRRQHILTRDYIAGVRMTETVISQMIIYGLLLLGEGVLMYGLLIVLKGVHVGPQFVYLLIIVLEQIWCGLCFGILISNIASKNVQAGCAVCSFMALTILLCGVIWPINGLPQWVMTAVKFLPQTQAIWSVRCILQRGITTDTHDFYLGYIIPVVWLVLFVLLTILINKIS